MTTIQVRLKTNAYPILVSQGAVASLPQQLKAAGLGADAVVVTNPLVARLHGKNLSRVLARGGIQTKFFEVEDSEKSKSMPVALDLIDRIVRYGVDKKLFVIAFGGGVVGDLTGFVAAIVKRGLPLVQVPTTLLAQVDSSIGGKVAVDLPAGKNLIGAFYQPRLVLADTAFLTTLTSRQVRNGLSEAVKYGVIADPCLFSLIEKEHRGLLSNDPDLMGKVVARCAAIKARVVSKDERETLGLRVILNFGHTVGHAVETAAGYQRYQHGEAVALGMRAAAMLSVRMGLMAPMAAVRLETLLSALELPESIEGCSLNDILASMRFDKKYAGRKNRFVLAEKIGQVKVCEGVPEKIIRRVISDLMA